ncbi:hypothetical protein EJB05_16766, partial [Eragrostis curvula]
MSNDRRYGYSYPPPQGYYNNGPPVMAPPQYAAPPPRREPSFLEGWYPRCPVLLLPDRRVLLRPIRHICVLISSDT